MIRGGLEYNLGIFVTGVDKDSEAERAGIQVIKKRKFGIIEIYLFKNHNHKIIMVISFKVCPLFLVVDVRIIMIHSTDTSR